MLALAGPLGAAEAPVVVASKIDTEGALLGQLIAATIEAQGIPVERRIGLGPTTIVRAAIIAGQIDVYPEYTGNGALFFHRDGDPAWRDAAKGYALVAALDKTATGLVWLAPAPADNTWVIAIRKDMTGFPSEPCVGDLAGYLKAGGRFRLAASAEFVESPAALPAFETAYGFHLSGDQLLTLSGGNTAATLRAAAEGISGVNAAMAYGTDGALAALRLTALCDDKHAQVVYAPAPVIRAPILDRNPGIAAALDKMFATLTRPRTCSSSTRGSRSAAAGRWPPNISVRIQIWAGGAMSAADAISRPVRMPRNQVLPSLVLVGLLAGLAGGFVTLAPNRLVSGMPVVLWRAARAPWIAVLAAAGAALAALGFAPPRRAAHWLAAGIAGAVLVTLAAAGGVAKMLAAGAPPLPPSRSAPGLEVIFACAALAWSARCNAEAGATAQICAAVLAAAGFLAMAKAGWFDALSLAREYMSRREVFAAAIVRHVVLVAAAIVPALLIGVPLGLAALRRKRLEAPLFAGLNLLQTVPSIALFGLLIGPLSGLAKAVPALGALGIGGVGPAPAIIALILYALLPVARSTLAGIAEVSPATIDAARGMGMTPRQIFRRVEIPLALPVLLAGLRIVAVQTIGLAVVAALIGAGGLGTFVFDGLGQYATDLVLLGARCRRLSWRSASASCCGSPP